MIAFTSLIQPLSSHLYYPTLLGPFFFHSKKCSAFQSPALGCSFHSADGTEEVAQNAPGRWNGEAKRVEKTPFCSSAGARGTPFKCPNLLILLGGNKEKVAWKLSNIAIHDVSCSSYYVWNSSHLSSRSSNHFFASKAFPKASSSQIEWRILWLISNIQRHSCNNLFWEPFKLHPPCLFSCESHGGISKLYQANKSRFWKVTAYGSYGRFIPATDGNQKSGINSPVEGGRLVVELLLFTKFHISKRCLFGISEPSTVSTLLLQRLPWIPALFAVLWNL